ncbi:hypothetical protein ARMGADRAFT_731948 [Armillaria gallica]|uniref:Secreted protein n=1 Tax=Armillaria gallica TaxID=47427 RepID=A0A2H3CHD2_ARMGA|nr:hypothetical protein ARMGADRAFT_731948 [Armillaria gallica]
MLVFRLFLFVMATLWTYGTKLQPLPESSYREPRNDSLAYSPSQKKMCVSDCGPTAQALNIRPRIQIRTWSSLNGPETGWDTFTETERKFSSR